MISYDKDLRGWQFQAWWIWVSFFVIFSAFPWWSQDDCPTDHLLIPPHLKREGGGSSLLFHWPELVAWSPLKQFLAKQRNDGEWLRPLRCILWSWASLLHMHCSLILEQNFRSVSKKGEAGELLTGSDMATELSQDGVLTNPILHSEALTTSPSVTFLCEFRFISGLLFSVPVICVLVYQHCILLVYLGIF